MTFPQVLLAPARLSVRIPSPDLSTPPLHTSTLSVTLNMIYPSLSFSRALNNYIDKYS